MDELTPNCQFSRPPMDREKVKQGLMCYFDCLLADVDSLRDKHGVARFDKWFSGLDEVKSLCDAYVDSFYCDGDIHRRADLCTKFSSDLAVLADGLSDPLGFEGFNHRLKILESKFDDIKESELRLSAFIRRGRLSSSLIILIPSFLALMSLLSVSSLRGEEIVGLMMSLLI